jgi:hypothetical protein
MATYVNDLRLKEIATGDESGTWGTSTNTNLELIGEALGYGTEAITTNADTHATTVADGAADPGRAMYIKYTGTLDSACTITIGPNTMSRVHIIENATSGSQNIIIKQGSGAEVTIPNGFVKAVYLDGAGSGAAVTEAFTDLSVGGNLLIDGTTPKLTIGDGGAEDTAIVFDGNAQDFYIGLDDSADDLIIGLGSTVGTTPIISVDENKDVAIPDGSLTITVDDNSNVLTLKSTDADENSGPRLALTRDSGSPADNDYIGLISFNADDDAGNVTRFGYMVGQIADASNTSEDGILQIHSTVGGTERNRINITSTETVFNEDSVDLDFRVESNNNANMLFLDAGNDAVSIGHGSTIAIAGERHELQVYDTNFSLISAATFRNGSDGANITLAHSRSGTIGTQTILQDGDTMGGINFMGSDGTDMASYGARIFCEVDGTPGSNDMPGRLIFATTSDGGTGSTTRLTISAGGTATFEHPIVVQSGATQGYYIENNAGNATTPRITNDANDHTVIRPGKSGGAVQWNNFANDAELMRLTDAGNLGIGIAAPNETIHVHKSSTPRIMFTDGTTGTTSGSDGMFLGISGDQGFNLWNYENTYIRFAVNNSEKMRISATGQLIVANTAAHSTSTKLHVEGGSTSAATPCVYFCDGDGSVEGNSTILEVAFDGDDSFAEANYVLFSDSGGTQGTIRGTGDGTVDYNTSSDERLKDNIRDTNSKWDMINSIKVRDFEWKQSGNTNTAFIAQEINSVYPEAAHEGGDDVKEDPWQVNYGRLTPILTKALQEAMARIEGLEAEVNKLKGE